MAILDRLNTFCKDRDICDADATEYTDVIDLGAGGDAENRRQRVHAIVKEAFTGTGTTLTLTVQTSITEAFSAPIDLHATAAIPKATLVAKYRIFGAGGLPLPSGCKQYLRIKCVGDDTFETTGQLSAHLSDQSDTNEF